MKSTKQSRLVTSGRCSRAGSKGDQESYSVRLNIPRKGIFTFGVDAVFNKGTIVEVYDALQKLHMAVTVFGREARGVKEMVDHTVESVLE